MSNAPYYVYGMRGGVKLGDQTMVDGMIKDGLWCCLLRRPHGRPRRVHGAEGRHHARGAGRVRGAVALARRSRRSRPESSRRRSCPSRSPDERAPTDRRHRRRPAQGHDGRDAGQAEARVSWQGQKRRAHGDCRQRIEPQRRRGGARGTSRGVRAATTGSTILARITGYATGGGEPQDLFFAPIIAVENLMKKTGCEDRRLRPHRGERGVRVAGDRRRPRARHGTGSAST